MRSMSLLIGFSIVIFVTLFFGSMGKGRTVEKAVEKQVEKKISPPDESPQSEVKQPSATE